MLQDHALDLGRLVQFLPPAMLGGLALMVLPSLIVGNELLILGAVVLAVGGWFLAHRHGQLRGLVAASTASPGVGTADQKS